ncbi:HNH endonuclease signature motif containing protein [Ramlibacter sp. AN1015]|uniref:HNH endonuclease signature motif containing protein n=1 Tax=Ramlibacter sp. AN1015 TaxID=3133428 RepID=UPI0030BECAB8
MNYDPDTGLFTWRVKPNRNKRVGDCVGSRAGNGYLRTRLFGVDVSLHRLAWAFMHGDWPTQDIDHINGDRTDNRIANLRDVPRRINAQNLRRARSNNISGLLGVATLANGKFLARIHVNGKNVRLGLFTSPAEAHSAYIAAKRELHEGCAV